MDVTLDTAPSFKIDCPACEVAKEFSDFQEARTFVSKHQKHTNHEMEWTQAEFNEEITTETKWRVSCETCEKTWEFGSADSAEGFQAEHAEVTDHKIAGQPEEIKISAADEDDLTPDTIKHTIEQAEDEFERGVPIQVVCATFTESGFELDDVLDQIENLRVKGKVYEPQVGHFRAT